MRGQEAILIVEDDQMLAELNRTIFEDKGYAVTVEIDSLQALERIRQNPRQFDLILSDQSMPGLTGLELTREAHKINPQLPVVICSGYSSGISPEANPRAQYCRVLCQTAGSLGAVECDQTGSRFQFSGGLTAAGMANQEPT